MLWIDVLKIVGGLGGLAFLFGMIYISVKAYWRIKAYWLRNNVSALHRTFQKVLFFGAAYFAVVPVVLTIAGGLAYLPWALETKAEEERVTKDAADALVNLKGKLDAERTSLMQLVQQRVAEGKLVEAKLAMSKYQALNDPVLQQVATQIDKEISISKLLESTKPEADPVKLAIAYRKLAELVPSSAEYRIQAEKFASAAQLQAKEQAAEDVKQKAYQTKYAASVARIANCVAAGNCAFRVWGALAGPAKMSFWILESEWRNFDSMDKEALRGKLVSYVSNMRSNAVNYASNGSVGAGVPRNAPAFPVVVENIRNASGWTIFLSPGHGTSGGLVQGRQIKNY